MNVQRNIPANLENSAVATGLEKVSFHSNPKERSRMQECVRHDWVPSWVQLREGPFHSN